MRLTLEGNPDPRRAYVFDWSQATESLREEIEDIFGDGAPHHFQLDDDDTWIPFVVVGLESPGDSTGQEEGLLFYDSESRQIIHMPVDGTALFDDWKLLADSFDHLHALTPA